MAPQKLVIFKHQSALGNAPAHKLFGRLTVARKPGIDVARSFADYEVRVDKTTLPAGIEVIDPL